MYCKNCGNQISDNSKFCSKCGVNIVDITNPIVENKKKSSNILLTIMIGFAIGIVAGIGGCSEIGDVPSDAPIALMFGLVTGILGAIIGAIVGKQ